MSENLDRINYSFNTKINLGNYESLSIGVSYSSDVKRGETPSSALKRVQDFVEKEVEIKIDEYKKVDGKEDLED